MLVTERSSTIKIHLKVLILALKFHRPMFNFASNVSIFAVKNYYPCNYSFCIIIDRVKYLCGEWCGVGNMSWQYRVSNSHKLQEKVVDTNTTLDELLADLFHFYCMLLALVVLWSLSLSVVYHTLQCCKKAYNTHLRREPESSEWQSSTSATLRSGCS